MLLGFLGPQQGAESGVRDAALQNLPHSLSREHASRKNIPDVHHRGQLAQGPQKVASAFEDYYSHLFNLQTPLHPVPENVLSELPKISDDLREAIDSPVTAAKIESVIKKLPKNKSPGPYGIVSEFYQAFGKSLSPILNSL